MATAAGVEEFPENAKRLGWFFGELLKAADGRASGLNSSTLAEHLQPRREVQGDFGPAREGPILVFGTGPAAGRLHGWGVGPDHAALILGYPATGQGCVVLAHGGLSARVLAVQLMQRIGIQDGWPVVPDY